ncbi:MULTISPECIES: RdgB/HAM1 family non-canonical purine NTP pyrophosphatase [Cyanophyceae]|uniref:RdgB/HAM1 family non-canonical purine NTP pyrophosphatase n=1 Tax=Cyanophyceae TaxID=3028117 RepID=UPI0016876B04|nr:MULTISPECIES: RdgB/HAM1 family non-canonical purine NTP pyrophosphatase [Cyanophyceae]MBD1915781.1 RdgB/HAM1 family non-canonical purine NTP pyrophosphatase [Phormidium sp. FACHB-77]MBD2030545.1 RdgB/HAM1 family non-canonical purine NTP pyrophosphatase [Phormidium sp. FACHB-322]MBD2053547.1 RdgB/HAM1 family non-canonical purine NTP pyrophosphatase [Leptolyngbya sp. FACHB-60]
MPTVIVATGNPGKLKEMQVYLGELGWALQLKPDALDIEETGTTFLENARLKAAGVAKALSQWAIADDSGLEVHALGGAPGIYSARYADSDQARIDRLLQELDSERGGQGSAGEGDRCAQFVCALALANPQGDIVLETEGICHGEILLAPRGSGGFGYDPIFYVPALGKSFAEMSPEQKDANSHRGVAFSQLMPHLKQLTLG